MGRPIRRSTLSTMANEYESRGNLAAPQQGEPQDFNPGAIFYGVNYTSLPIRPGDRLHLFGFHNSNMSYMYTYRRLLNGKIKLKVRRKRDDDGDTDITGPGGPIIFQAITPAAQDHICKFKAIPSNLFFAIVYSPDGSDDYYNYITIDGVATNNKDEAFAFWNSNTLPSDPDQQGGRYYVALCVKIQEEGLSLEEVDDEIDSVLSGKLITNTVAGGIQTTIDANGFLNIGYSQTTLKYYGES